MERRTLLRRAGIACVTIAAAGCAGPGGGENETENDTGGEVGANDSASVDGGEP
jgi:hypothetical protein